MAAGNDPTHSKADEGDHILQQHEDDEQGYFVRSEGYEASQGLEDDAVGDDGTFRAGDDPEGDTVRSAGYEASQDADEDASDAK
jgi:hypothetical protein